MRHAWDLEGILKGTLRWPSEPADRDVLLFLAQSLRARLAKELPAERKGLSPSATQMAHRAKALLVDLADISLEVSKDLPGFTGALRAGWIALVNVALVALAVVGFSLPFLPLVALAWWLTRRSRRRHQRGGPPLPPAARGSPPLPPPQPVEDRAAAPVAPSTH